MGKRGTKNTAVSILKDRRTYRADRHDKGLKSRSVDFIPTAPDTLNEEGQRVWYEFFGYAMEITGYLAKTEIGLVEQACRSWQEYRELIKVVEMEGRVIMNAGGQMCVNPHYRLMTDAQDRYLKIMRELGMTPTTRSGVSLMNDKPKDDFQDI